MCELGGPGTLALPNQRPTADWLLEHDGPAELLDIGSVQIGIDAADFADYVDATARTRVTVRLTPRG